jgi:hypothetical protein
MKATIFSNRISVLILMVCLLGFGTCKKDKDSETNYRVIASNDYYNNVLTANNLMVYQGEKISLIQGYDLSSKGDSTKTEFDYPDASTIVATGYYQVGNEWNLESKNEYKHAGNNITQTIIYVYDEFGMTPYIKVDFQYQNDKLAEEIYSLYDAGTWYPFTKVSYTYDGNKAIQSQVTMDWGDGWEIAYKEVATYNGAELVNIIEYDYSEGVYTESYKYEFLYVNGQIKQIDFFYFEENWISDGSNNYTYDDFGNLASMGESGDYKTEYTYEQAKGNLDQILFASGGISGLAYPIPVKSVNPSFSNINKFLAKKAEH